MVTETHETTLQVLSTCLCLGVAEELQDLGVVLDGLCESRGVNLHHLVHQRVKLRVARFQLRGNEQQEPSVRITMENTVKAPTWQLFAQETELRKVTRRKYASACRALSCTVGQRKEQASGDGCVELWREGHAGRKVREARLCICYVMTCRG